MDGYILVEEEPLDLGIRYCTSCGGLISAPYYYASIEGEEEEDEEKKEEEKKKWEGITWAYERVVVEVDDDEAERELYVHKACGDLPETIEHKLHPGHSLRRSETRVHLPACSICKGSLDSFQDSFNCSDCQEFALDISCVLKLFPITRECHQHPLIPIHEEEGEDFLCAICRRVEKEISFKCTTCPFRVHQHCLSSHPSKPHTHRHGLKLISTLAENHSGGTILCQICGEDMKEELLAYHCARCAYFFHTHNCRTRVHFRHDDDPLVLVEEVNPNDDYPWRECNVCELQISVPYYACTRRSQKYCRSFFLHKICEELPETLKHHLHPGHTLTLLKELELNEPDRMCGSCHLPWRGLSYSCAHASCCFHIDIVCAMKTSPAKHEFHQHPLISSHSKASFACAACDIDSEGTSYECLTCRFWVHQQCASLPKFKKNDWHPHKLKLNYSFSPPPGSSQAINCQVCREEIKPHRWAYQCAGCKYFTHVHDCEDPNWNTEEFDYEEALAAAVNLPAANESVRLATLFMETNQEEDRIQVATGIKSRIMLFYGPDKTCDKCSKLVAAPCNRCAMCKYIFLKSPSELQDPSLLERYFSLLEDTEKCNGIYMSFDENISHITISSSVLPRYVKHEGHKHVLLTTYISEKTWCNACERYFQGYGFRCNICGFTIDTYCALLPGSITHRYDKEHPFKLTYYSTEGVEEYVCEICEEDIKTMWFYHCEECDHSIHPSCIWKIHFEFGPFVKYGFHAHESVMIPISTLSGTYSCSNCGEKEISGCRYSLFCQECFDLVHLQCVPAHHSPIPSIVTRTLQIDGDHENDTPRFQAEEEKEDTRPAFVPDRPKRATRKPDRYKP